MNYLISINENDELFTNSNKKKLFKEWLKSEIEHIKNDIKIYKKDDDKESVTYEINRIKEVKKYMRNFDKNISGAIHLNNLLVILDLFEDYSLNFEYKEIG